MENYQKLIDIVRQYCSHLDPIPTKLKPLLEKLPNIRAVVFDVYGTLFISGSGDISLAVESSTDNLFLQAFADAGLKINPEENNISDRFYEYVISHKNRIQKQGTTFPEVEIRAVWHDFLSNIHFSPNTPITPSLIENLAIRYECLSNPAWPFPHLIETINTLHKKNLYLSIISNSQFYTPLLFDALLGKSISQLNFVEESCIWSYQLLQSKPSIALYEKGALFLQENANISPEEVLYVGNDVLKDIKPAQSVGFRTALFAGDSRSLRLRRDDFSCNNVSSDVTITDLPQILDCLP